MSLKNDDAGKLFIRMALALVIGFHGCYKLTHGAGWFVGIQAILFYCTLALFSTESGKYALSSSGKWG